MATITVENRTQINLEEGFLDRVIELANLPSGTILLIFHDGGIGNRYGGTIPKSLIKYAKSLSIFNLYDTNFWNCWVMLSKEACDHKEKFPAYFTYLLGHELGHAYICLTDLRLHIFSCLVDLFIKDASDNKITKYYELPHERRFDQFGIYIAEHLFSRNKINNEIKDLLKDPGREDHEWLKFLLSLESTNTFDDLNDSLISLVKPYKDKLIELWKKNIIDRKGNSIACEIDNFGALFE